MMALGIRLGRRRAHVERSPVYVLNVIVGGLIARAPVT